MHLLHQLSATWHAVDDDVKLMALLLLGIAVCLARILYEAWSRRRYPLV